jgi:hypothetical protein
MVDHDMIRMTVAAVLIICNDNIRAVLTHDRHELTCHILYLGLGKGIGLCISLPAVHARVMIAEWVEMRHTEDGRGLLQLCMAHLREALTVGRLLAWLETQAWILDVTKITVGTGHEYGRVALLCRQA